MLDFCCCKSRKCPVWELSRCGYICPRSRISVSFCSFPHTFLTLPVSSLNLSPVSSLLSPVSIPLPRSRPHSVFFLFHPCFLPLFAEQCAGPCARHLCSRRHFVSPLSVYCKMTLQINNWTDIKQTAVAVATGNVGKSTETSCSLFVFLSGGKDRG